MDDQTVQSLLLMALKVEQEEGHVAEVYDEESTISEVATFNDRGIMTTNKGIVLSFADGSEFQITIVRSR
jgi:hypothetical protein